MRPLTTFVKEERVKLGKEIQTLTGVKLILPLMRFMLLDRLTFDQYRQ